MYLESNENEDTNYQKLWYTAKVVLRGRHIAISVNVFKTNGRAPA
jgi:hypothetical protein